MKHRQMTSVIIEWWKTDHVQINTLEKLKQILELK